MAFKSREDHRKQLELEEARKAGLSPAEVDEDEKKLILIFQSICHLYLGISCRETGMLSFSLFCYLFSVLQRLEIETCSFFVIVRV